MLLPAEGPQPEEESLTVVRIKRRRDELAVPEISKLSQGERGVYVEGGGVMPSRWGVARWALLSSCSPRLPAGISHEL